jgi:hypothetical protein
MMQKTQIDNDLDWIWLLLVTYYQSIFGDRLCRKAGKARKIDNFEDRANYWLKSIARQVIVWTSPALNVKVFHRIF